MNHWKSKAQATFVDEEYADMPPLIPASATTSKPPAPAPASPSNAVQKVTVTVTTTKTTTTHVYPSITSAPTTPTTKPVASSPPPLVRKKKPVDQNEWNFERVKKFTAPAGTYYIGDICYFLKDELYDGVFGGKGYESGLYTRKSDGAFFMVDNTSWGDGCYIGSDRFEYGVDAGIIGIVSRSLGPEKDQDMYGGKFHTFRDPVEIKFGDGVFRFKSHWNYLVIDTSDENRYNSDEDW
jgi:hypothetical protein